MEKYMFLNTAVMPPVGSTASSHPLAQNWSPPRGWSNSLASNINRLTIALGRFDGEEPQVAVCAKTANGSRVLYATNDFIDALETQHSGNTVLWGALNALAKPAIFITERPPEKTASFFFSVNSVEYLATLHYVKKKNSTTTRGKISGVEIFKNQDIVFSNMPGHTVGTEPAPTEWQGSLTNREKAIEQAIIYEMNASASHRWSSAAHVREMVKRSQPLAALTSSSMNTASPQTTPPVISWYTGPSSLDIASSIDSMPTIFDVLCRKAEPSDLPVYQHGVYETLLRTTAENSDDTYERLVPKDLFAFTFKSENKYVRDSDKTAFKLLMRFLNSQQPPQTLAHAMTNLATFHQTKNASQQTYLGRSAYAGFINRFRLCCFYLPAVELCMNPRIKLTESRGNAITLGAAADFEELLAINGTSMAVLLHNGDRTGFAAYSEMMRKVRHDIPAKAMLRTLLAYFNEMNNLDGLREVDAVFKETE